MTLELFQNHKTTKSTRYNNGLEDISDKILRFKNALLKHLLNASIHFTLKFLYLPLMLFNQLSRLSQGSPGDNDQHEM